MVIPMQFYLPLSKRLKTQLLTQTNEYVDIDFEITSDHNQTTTVHMRNVIRGIVNELRCRNSITDEWFQFDSTDFKLKRLGDCSLTSRKIESPRKKSKKCIFDLSRWQQQPVLGTQFTMLCRPKTSSNLPYIRFAEQIDKITFESIVRSHPVSIKNVQFQPYFCAEVWLEIFKHMDYQQLTLTRLVCKKFCELVDKFCLRRIALLVQTPFEISSLNPIEKDYGIVLRRKYEPTFDHVVPKKTLSIFMNTIHWKAPAFVQHLTDVHIELHGNLNQAQIIDLSLFRRLRSLTVIGSAVQFVNHNWAKLESLESLRLIKNRIKFLVFFCPNLRRLECSGQQINLISLEILSNLNGELPRLEKLKVNGEINYHLITVIKSVCPQLEKLRIDETSMESIENLIRCKRLQKISCRLTISTLRLTYLFEEVQKQFYHLVNKMHKRFDLNSISFVMNGHRITNDQKTMDTFLNYLKEEKHLPVSIQESPNDSRQLRHHKLINSKVVKIYTLKDQSASLFKFSRLTQSLEVHGPTDMNFLHQIPQLFPFLRTLYLNILLVDDPVNTYDRIDLHFLIHLRYLQKITIEGNGYDYKGLILTIRFRPRLTKIAILQNSNLERTTLSQICDAIEAQARNNPTLRYSAKCPKLFVRRSFFRLGNLSIH